MTVKWLRRSKTHLSISPFNPFTVAGALRALIDFTLSSIGNPLAAKGLTTIWIKESREDINGYTLTQQNAVLDGRAGTVLFVRYADKQSFITRFYWTSCEIFTISKISLFPEAYKFTSLDPGFPILYTWGVMGIYFLVNLHLYFC